MTLLKDRKLALFFTFGVSLKLWSDIGTLEREVALYNRLGKYFSHIYFFTYGGREDLKFQSYLAKNITIIPSSFFYASNWSKVFFPLILIYSFFLPLIHYGILKNTDIFKTNQMYGSWTAVISKVIFRKKLIVRTGYTWSLFAEKANSSPLRNFMITIIERFAYLFSDGIIVTSQEDLEYLEKKYLLKGIKNVISNYIDTDVFKPLNTKKRKDSICFVGRLSKQKNLFSLLEAIVDLPYILTVVGSGPQRDVLENYAREKKVKVEFLDNIPNSKISAVLNQHAMFILPSFYEGNPKALLEAMACGLPVIGTDVDGIREVIKHEENGILCSTDAASIRKAILKLMIDEDLKRKIGQKARATIEEQFSLEKVIKKELNVHNQVLL